MQNRRFSANVLLRRRGAVALQIGLLLAVFLGFASIGIEIPLLMYQQRQLQIAANSSASSSATAVMLNWLNYPAHRDSEATGTAAALGYVNGVNGVTVTVNYPPQSGNYAGNGYAVEVIITQQKTLTLARLFGLSNVTLYARAVGSPRLLGYNCLLTMDPSGSKSVTLGANDAITFKSCGMAVTSTASDSLSAASGSFINPSAVVYSAYGVPISVFPAVTAGGIGNSGTLNGNTFQYLTSFSPMPTDPYATATMPSSTGCDHTGYSLSSTGSTALSPGRYCNGLSISGGATVTLSSGIYYIKSGQFSVSGAGTSVTGSSVTIVLTSNDGTNSYATVSISNGANVTLSASTSGTTGGILFFGDRNSPTSSQSSFSGFGTLNLTGAIYLPTHTVTYSGTASSTIGGCNQLIAWDFQDNLKYLTFDNTCNVPNMRNIITFDWSYLVE